MTRPAEKVVIANSSLAKLMPRLAAEYQVIAGWVPQDPSIYLGVGVMVVAGDVPLDFGLMEMMPDLRLVACATRGYDAVDVDRLSEAGMSFTLAEGVNEEDVADHALGTIIMHRRSLMEGTQALRRGDWDRGGTILNRSMICARLGIVGLGRIGGALAKRATALRMSVSWWGPRAKPSPWPRVSSLVELARTSEILAVAARSHDNGGLISAEVIDALGPEGFLVNVARGQLVDEQALIGSLRAGRLGGAALDVFDREPTPASRWADVPNAFLTPHMSGKTQEAFGRMTRHLSETLKAFFAETRPLAPESAALPSGAGRFLPETSNGARESCSI